jgi:hypothetical protein
MTWKTEGGEMKSVTDAAWIDIFFWDVTKRRMVITDFSGQFLIPYSWVLDCLAFEDGTDK